MQQPSLASSFTSWPPLTLVVNTEELINECEFMEVCPDRSIGRSMIAVVELAALLYTGDTVSARHLWRRETMSGAMATSNNNEKLMLQDWWMVGRGMIECNPTMLWQALETIQQNHPAPLPQYALEVGTAYRRRVVAQFAPNLVDYYQQQQQQQQQSASSSSSSLQSLPTPPPPPSQPYWSLLNFASLQDWNDFVQKEKENIQKDMVTLTSPFLGGGGDGGGLNFSMDGKTSLTQVVAFLESTPWNITS